MMHVICMEYTNTYNVFCCKSVLCQLGLGSFVQDIWEVIGLFELMLEWYIGEGIEVLQKMTGVSIGRKGRSPMYQCISDSVYQCISVSVIGRESPFLLDSMSQHQKEARRIKKSLDDWFWAESVDALAKTHSKNTFRPTQLCPNSCVTQKAPLILARLSTW